MPSGQRSSTPAIHNEIWHAATTFIEGRVGELLTVSEIARAALTSERQLQRVFAQEGATVRQYISTVRMRHAAALAVRTNASVTEIAGAVGYAHASAFIKAFRMHHGVTPTELRRRERLI